MREIKFRVWHKGQNKMLPVYALDWVSNSKDKRSQKGSVSQVLCERCVSVFDTTYSFPIWEVELMQFTGLKDKNGKEIYEGDILGFQVRRDGEVIGVDHYEVIFVSVTGRWELKKPGHDYSQPFSGDMDKSEVIGNIHENPELLK